MLHNPPLSFSADYYCGTYSTFNNTLLGRRPLPPRVVTYNFDAIQEGRGGLIHLGYCGMRVLQA